MSQKTTPEFGKWRSRFWPVHAYELKKILPMLAMFFLISFNYTVLRDTKDSIIVPSCGADAIPFLKVWGTVPAAILFMIVYSKMSNVLSKQRLFMVTILPFMAFFALFAFVLYPMRDLIHPTTSAEWLQNVLPDNLGAVVAIYKNWTYAVFYVLAELWGSAVLSLLFWGFANDITRVSEAKRFYALLGIGANLALIFSGWGIKFFSRIGSGMEEHAAWGLSLKWMMGAVVVNGLLVMFFRNWMDRSVLSDPRFYSQDEAVKTKKSKPKLGLLASFTHLLRSPYMLCLAGLVICYGLSINLIEVSWKNQLKMQFPDHTDYSYFMGGFSQATGAFTIVMILLVSSTVITRFGWLTAALITPVIVGITGFIFYGFLLGQNNLGGMAAMLGATPTLLLVAVGAIQNVLSKGTKYSLFDPTKEMAYIPLDQDEKVKGKAAVDVVGARLGKSGGSLLQQVLIVVVGIGAMTPYIAVIVAGVVVVWIMSAIGLSKQFAAKQAAKADEAAATTQPLPSGAEPARA